MSYLNLALFHNIANYTELSPSEMVNEIGLDWNDRKNLNLHRIFEKNVDKWIWNIPNTDIAVNSSNVIYGITWGGCLECIDDILRCDLPLPDIDQFHDIILLIESSEVSYLLNLFFILVFNDNHFL